MVINADLGNKLISATDAASNNLKNKIISTNA
jgi:hypothetical protein